MAKYKHQIIDMDQCQVLVKYSGYDMYYCAGTVYYPSQLGRDFNLGFYRRNFGKSDSYDFAYSSIETLQEYLGDEFILYDNYQPTKEKTNKATLLQALRDSEDLTHDEYLTIRGAIKNLEYYILDSEDSE